MHLLPLLALAVISGASAVPSALGSAKTDITFSRDSAPRPRGIGSDVGPDHGPDHDPDVGSDSNHESKHGKPDRHRHRHRFRFNSTDLPEVDFDIGEAYAGLLPIGRYGGGRNGGGDDDDCDHPERTDDGTGKKVDDRELFFVHIPSTNVNATDEILIWLNGGPGCSSLDGFWKENGPIVSGVECQNPDRHSGVD